MTAEQTLNVTVAQIEDALLAGQTVPDFAREWSEPPANVLAIYRRLQREGRIPVNGPAQVAATPQRTPLVSVPPAQPTSGSAPTVDALVNAAARSSSKRTQVLGTKLHDLAEVIRARLAEERDAAEKEERAKAEREAAAAEVDRLERQLAEARAKLRPSRQGGGSPVQRDKKPLSDAQRATLEKARAGQANSTPCAKGCGFVAKTAAGRSAHERNCAGVS